MQGVTYKPEINQKSKKLAQRRDGNYVDRLYSPPTKKTDSDLNQLDYNRQAQDCTFKPNTNLNVKKVSPGLKNSPSADDRSESPESDT